MYVAVNSKVVELAPGANSTIASYSASVRYKKLQRNYSIARLNTKFKFVLTVKTR
jgi:hypothetical protein